MRGCPNGMKCKAPSECEEASRCLSHPEMPPVADFGLQLPELPIDGPRALSPEDLKGHTTSEWQEIIESESNRSA